VDDSSAFEDGGGAGGSVARLEDETGPAEALAAPFNLAATPAEAPDPPILICEGSIIPAADVDAVLEADAVDEPDRPAVTAASCSAMVFILWMMLAICPRGILAGAPCIECCTEDCGGMRCEDSAAGPDLSLESWALILLSNI